MGLKQKANKDKVGNRPIPAPTTAQLEILTQLRLQARNRVYALLADGCCMRHAVGKRDHGLVCEQR
ncbi:hypothetical protein N7527_003350 [Penicillium freii]|nr:hypothetical protein N7527_003350 [Penicillium freii]